MDLVIQNLNRILSGRKIFWIGGGYYLVQPTLACAIAGGMVFSLDDEQYQLSTHGNIINLEDSFVSRPDWNRLTDSQTYNSLTEHPKLAHFINRSDCLLFPYYVSSFAEKLSQIYSIPLIGNPSEHGEKLYLRSEGRKVAEGSGLALPETKIFKFDELPSYLSLCKMLKSNLLVLTPPYSDGGAWAYVAPDESRFIESAADIKNSFENDYIEITPFYDGIPINLNICNIPIDNGNSCSVVVYPPSVQIIGEPTLSDSKLRYCGCDFLSTESLLNRNDLLRLQEAAVSIGKKMFDLYNWKGLFGVDLIVRPDRSFLFLEINPRLQSSTYVLDKFFRNELNPILLQIKSFLCHDIQAEEFPQDLIFQKIKASMLIVYNNKSVPLFMKGHDIPLQGSFGFPKKSKCVDPGAILFRYFSEERALATSMKKLTTNLKQKINSQIDASFTSALTDVFCG